MLIPTFFFVVLIIVIFFCIQLNLDDTIADDIKLSNIQKINIVLVVIVLCYICLFLGKVIL